MIDSSAVNSGRNRDLGTYKDNRYTRCSRCGFICHKDRDTRAPEGSRKGYGIRIDVSAVPRNFTEV